MDNNRGVNSFNVGYAFITGIIYIIVAKGFGSGIEFIKTFAVSLLDFFGGFAGLGDAFYSQNQGDLLVTDPYFWFIFFVIGSVFSAGISYYLSDEGIADKVYAAIGTAFSQLIIGRIVTAQRVTLPVQIVLLFVAFGFYFLYCEKLKKNALLIIIAPILLPTLELIIILPFVFVASMLPDILAIAVAILGFIVAVFICYPLLSRYYYRNILRMDSSISNFNIGWVMAVLVFCVVFGNQPQESTDNSVNTDGTEYHNSFAEKLNTLINEKLEEYANWISEGEYDRIKNGENVESTKETATYSVSETERSNESHSQDNGLTEGASLEETGNEKTFFENNDIKVSVLDRKHIETNVYGAQSNNGGNQAVLTVEIINKRNDERDFFVMDEVASINDSVTVPAFFGNYISEDNKITADILIDTDYLYDFGIRTIGDIKFRIQSYYPVLENGEETGTFELGDGTNTIDVRTDCYGQAETGITLENAIEFCRTNEIRIIGRYEDSFGRADSAGILMLVENNTGHDISVSFGNLAINNKVLEWSSGIEPHIVKKGTKAISFYDTSQPYQDKLKTEDVSEIDFYLDIEDNETSDSIIITDSMKLIQLVNHEWMISR